jgi:glycosyltransferase involved in cell wall biosynthesis
MQQQGISAVIICRDEQRTIAAAIDSLLGLVDEILVLDTGSTDSTLDILSGYGDAVTLHTCRWNDDFSAARNFAIAQTRYRWCLMLDADEYIASESRPEFRQTLTRLMHEDRGRTLYAPLIDNLNGTQLLNNARLFKKRPSLRYYGRVHEYLREAQSEIRFVPEIRIHHTGYLTDSEHQKHKHQRNWTLLQQQMALEPNNLRWQYFALRYLPDDGPKYTDIMRNFAALPLPYDSQWEIYALNIKARFIHWLLLRGEPHQAFQHAEALYQHYQSREVTTLYLLARYLNARENFREEAWIAYQLQLSLNDLESDDYLTERADIGSFRHALAEFTQIANGNLLR